MGFTIKACAESSEFKEDFKVQEDVCYDMMDPAVWNAMTDEAFPEEEDIERLDTSFCSTDMCNDNDDTCDNKMAARGLANLFGETKKQ